MVKKMSDKQQTVPVGGNTRRKRQDRVIMWYKS